MRNKEGLPQPIPNNSHVVLVLNGLKEGQLTPQIRRSTGLESDQLAKALNFINHQGYFPRSDEERERARRDGIRMAKDGLVLPVEFFTYMGMSTVEVGEAVRFVYGAEPTKDKLTNRVRSARKTRPLTPKEIALIKGTRDKRSPETLRDDILLWLDAAALVLSSTAKKVPQTRMEWLSLVDIYREGGKISSEALHWKRLGLRYKKKHKALPTDWSSIRDRRADINRKIGNTQHNHWEKNMEELLRKREAAAVILPRVYPLALRRLPVWDIALITGIPQLQVEIALSNMRSPKEKHHKVANTTREERRRDHSRARAGRKRGEPRVPSTRQERLFNLVWKFQEVGLITDDLSLWEEVGLLYATNARQMPQEPADRVILEMYLKALKAHIGGDDQLVNTWKDIEKQAGEEVLESLAQEKVFIRVKTVAHWADGEDGKGLYTVSENGRKQYRPVIDGGEVGFDTSNLAIKRARMRMQVASGK